MPKIYKSERQSLARSHCKYVSAKGCVKDRIERADQIADFNYRGLYTSAVQPWIFIDENNLIAAYLGYSTPGLSVDHIVEIETIVAYFTADWIGTLDLSQNQWGLISAFLNSQGNIWSNAVSLPERVPWYLTQAVICAHTHMR